MKKLKPVIYNKLALQAEEAKDLGLKKLASSVHNAIGSVPEEENTYYNYDEMMKDVSDCLWKSAMQVISYYNVESVDVQKLDELIEVTAEKLVEELEDSLELNEPNESPLIK